MTWRPPWRRDADRDRQLKDELQFHVEQETDRRVAAGISPDEARRRALASFGGVAQVTEACRNVRGWPGLESIWHDVRFGARTLRQNRTFTTMTVLSLALGIGACATLFAVARAVVLRDLPFPDPARLVRLHEIDPRGGSWQFSAPDLLDLGSRARSIAQVAGFRVFRRALSNGPGAVPVNGAEVSASFFDALGLRPIAGTTFAPDANQPGADAHRAVITESLWIARFARTPDIAGRPLTLAGQSYRITGVVVDVPDLLPDVQIFTPLALDHAADRGSRDIEALARLAPHATETQAQQELATVAEVIDEESPLTNAGWSLRLGDLKASIVGTTVRRIVWVQCGVVALFALLACTNVAGLLLTRGRARRGELSIRAALGADRRRLVRQLLVENALLAVTGAAVGSMLTAVAIDGVRRFGSAILPRLGRVAFDPSLLAFIAGLTIVVLPILGLGPALSVSRAAFRQGLAERGRAITPRVGGRSALVAVQTAIATTLLVAAALLFKSFLTLGAVDPGFSTERLLAVTPILDGTASPDDHLAPFYTDLVARLGRLPGVDAAGATNVTPLGAWSSAVEFRRADRPENTPLLAANWRTVTPGFFRAMGLPLFEGRFIDDRDTATAPPVVVVTAAFARLAWPGEDALGKQVVWGRTGTPKTVIGVVGDLRDHALDRDPQPTMFRAFAQLPWSDMTFIVRAKRDPIAVAREVRAAVRQAAPSMAIEIRPMSQIVSTVLLQPRVNMLLLASFSGFALTLAAIGLYGVVSYRVRARRREIAIRIALGGQPGTILWSLVRQSLLVALSGGVAGLLGGFAASRAIASLLYDTRPGDPLVYAGVFLTLIVVVLTAALVPARQALHVNPMEILKQE